MKNPNEPTPDQSPPSLGNTIFMSGLCFAAGLFPLLIGLGVISGNVEAGPAGRLLAIVAGIVFILAGIMVLLRDTAGVRNNEAIPAHAPFWIRLGESFVGIATIAAFAGLCSIVAFGPFFSPDMLPDMIRQMGSAGAAIFRILMGAFAIVFWYIVAHLVLTKIRGNAGSQP